MLKEIISVVAGQVLAKLRDTCPLCVRDLEGCHYVERSTKLYLSAIGDSMNLILLDLETNSEFISNLGTVNDVVEWAKEHAPKVKRTLRAEIVMEVEIDPLEDPIFWSDHFEIEARSQNENIEITYQQVDSVDPE